MSATPMSYAAGSVIAGKYQIQGVLGQGGMGTVYLATHRLLERLVALKILHNHIAAKAISTERLLREGRALARLRGPHIARVLDVEASENGPCFLVLEYLEGENLSQVLQRTGPLPIDRAVAYVLEACEALAEAHELGIIHRDIKPSNLFLTTLDAGTQGVKVIDFGIAKHENMPTSITQSRSVVGSPCYMAPEQMRANGLVDVRSDIWSLGVVLYELLTGKPPHAGDSLLEICASILESPPKRPSAIRPDLPAGIDAVVCRCMARDPAERFANVHELARSLVQFRGVATGRLAWIVPSANEVRLSRGSESAPEDEPAASSRRGTIDDTSTIGPRKRTLTLIAAGIVGLFVLVGVWLGRIWRPALPDTVAQPTVTRVNEPFPRALAAAAAPVVVPVASEDAPKGPASPAARTNASRRRAHRSLEIPAPTAANASDAPPVATARQQLPDPVLQYGRY